MKLDPNDPKPGIYERIPFGRYRAIEAVNASLLKQFAKTAAHARHYITNPPDETPALRLGHATHCAVLEPDRFRQTYFKAPKVDRRTKAGKAEYAAWEAELPADAHILSGDEYDTCLCMAEAAWADSMAADMLGGKGHNELTMIWQDEKTGLLCKGRIDRITRFRDWNVVLDVKTTRSAEIWSFSGDIARFGYHVSAAFYLDALAILQPADWTFVFLGIEKDAPHCPRGFGLDDDAIAQGRRDYQRYLMDYKKATDSGEWPGYPAGPEWIALPKYAYDGGNWND